MYKLLQAGGVSVSYNVGTITLTPAQFGKWTGLIYSLNTSAQTFQVDAAAACR